MREPWFHIIDVTEDHGLSLADIVRQEADRHQVRLDDLRGPRQAPIVRAARRAIYHRVLLERPDLTSEQVGMFMRKEPSTIRHAWRKEAA